MKKISLKILGIILLIVVVIQSNMVFATSTTDLKNEQNANNKKINEVQSDLEEVKAQKSETVKQVEELSTQIDSYQSQIDELDNQIAELNTKIQNSQQKLNKAQEDYTKQQELLDARLVATYEAGETSYLDVILASESITDLISNYYLVTELATNDSELLEGIQKQKEEVEQAKKQLEDSKQELSTSKASKQSVATQLQNTKQEKNKQIEQLSGEEKELQSKIEELNQANRSIDSKIKAMQAQIEAAKKQSVASGNANVISKPSSSGFIKPVNSYVTTGMYYKSGQYHGAVDFGAGGINGAPVHAVADGIVVTAEALTYSYGNYIIIAHYNGLYTLYAHGQAGSIAVSAGQTVKQGQQIMRVGSTGNSTGPHLHFEVRVSPGLYANRVNPMNYL